MTFHRASQVIVCGAAIFGLTAFKPLDVHIGDSIERVDFTLGRRFEKVPAAKFTDSMRSYDRGGAKFLVAFKAQKVCIVEYLGSFTEEEIFALLRSAAPGDKWKVGTPETTKYGTTRYYQTADGHLLGYAVEGRCIVVHTREIDY
jgi:hypothetical protein